MFHRAHRERNLDPLISPFQNALPIQGMLRLTSVASVSNSVSHQGAETTV